MEINLCQAGNYKLKLISYFLVSIFLIFLISGCRKNNNNESFSQPKKSTNQSENMKVDSDDVTFWRSYTNKRHNYSINYPDNWKIDDNSKRDWKGQGYVSSKFEIYRYGAKQVSQTELKDGVWLMVYVAGNSDNLSLKDWIKQREFTGKEEEIKIGNIDAIKVSNEIFSPEGLNNKPQGITIDVYMPYGEKIYNISSQVFGGDYQSYKDVINQVIASFRFLI
jgi:hypothetical protein